MPYILTWGILVKCQDLRRDDKTPVVDFNPKRSLARYAQTNFLFGICLPVFRLQWNPIAPSKQKNICSKIEVIIIITC